MYKLLLTFRYLRRKLIPVFALLAVALCTLMVIVVSSVMGGFLDLVRNSGKTLIGDVLIYGTLSGFPHYTEMISEIEKLPEARAATPVVIAYGLVKLPGDVIREVQVHGIDGHGQDRVTQFSNTLYWKPERIRDQPDIAAAYGTTDPIALSLEMKPPWPAAAKLPAMIPGLEVSPYNQRTSDGGYMVTHPMVGTRIILTVLPVTAKGGVLEPKTQQFVGINEFMSGLYAVDNARVYIPFEEAQKMMAMEGGDRVATDTGGQAKVVGKVPPRCTEIHIRAAEGVPADQLRDAAAAVYDRMAEKYPDLPPRGYGISIVTWEQRQEKFLKPVENEKGLMTVLFGIISVVAVVLIGVMFYMIVMEKTRDVGILRAVGASRGGIASIFLSFGAVIGTLGAGLGTAGAWAIVHYINEIHQKLGDWFGIVIWDRRVYFFDHIPSRVNWNEVAVIVGVAIVASLVGAAIPAVKAARVDPIESLRYE